MTDQQPQFEGAIVLKARSEAETAALAVQLAWYAAFGEVFSNRYEGGYAVKGQVYRASPEGAPDTASLEAQNRDQAARIGQLEQQIERLGLDLRLARSSAKQAHQLLQLLSQEEHIRLIDRNIAHEYPDLWPKASVVEGDDNPATQALAYALLEAAARTIEESGPDDVHVTLRAAERCAALVRGLQPAKKQEPKL